MAHVFLSRATALARGGRYDSAELVLSNLPRSMPDALDLLARIRAQQGRVHEAGELWREALLIETGNPRYADGLRKAEQCEAAPWRRRVRLPILVALLTILAAGLTLAAGRMAVRLQARSGHPAERPPDQVASRHPPERPSGRVIPELAAFSVPGVVQSRSGANIVLRFESGLFSEGVLLTPWGRKTLTAVGRRIEPHWRGLSLAIVGHTDDLPLIGRVRFPDNESLALARANTVIRTMRTITAIPVSAWTIRMKPGDGFLYPTDSFEGRMKNRTVEILITPEQITPQ